ncbi:hypothetical protein CFBP5875_06635 [Agrobacterium pusense]|nr:hypothetical protein CFBP5875_06635 [Agrobacterium pusense]
MKKMTSTRQKGLFHRRSPSPSSLCLSQESSRRRSTRRKTCFSPRTWAGWFSVTSTGMRDKKTLQTHKLSSRHHVLHAPARSRNADLPLQTFPL